MPNFNNTVNINQCRQLLWRLLRKSPDSHENYIHCLGRILNYLGHEDISFFECPGDVFVYLHLELWSEIWSQVETHPNARCELMDLQLSTCDRITLDRWRTPRLISLFFLSLRCSWRGPLFLLWRTSSATQFVSTSLAHHSYSVFLHIKCQAHWPLCVSCWSESSLATTSLTGERVAATEPSLSDWTGVGGWRAPQWAGTETRGAGREDAASCSASSITRAHWESRRAARQTSLRPICLQMWQGTDKRDGETRARQHLSQSVCQTLDTVRCSNASLPGSLQWVQADIFLLLAAGQARRATISTISVIASKHKRTCVPFSQSTQFVPLACYCCIQATELNICLVTRDGV